MFEHFQVYKYSYLDDRQKESHVIVDMKKAVRATKKNNSNPRPHANKKVMNFDFWVDTTQVNDAQGNNISDASDNIIVEAYTLKEGSPSTINSNLMPYQDKPTKEAPGQFSLYKNYEGFGTNRHQISQNSWKANSEIVGTNSHQELLNNPYSKEGKFNINSVKKPTGYHKKQPYSCVASNHQNSRPTSAKRTPMKSSTKAKSNSKERPRAPSHKSNKVRRSRKRRNMSGSIESAENPEIKPVYIDTGGSNMQ